MTSDPSPLWESTFQPDNGMEDFRALRDDVVAQRTALGLDALKQSHEILKATNAQGLPQAFIDLLERNSKANILVFDDPVYAIWLRFFLRAMANKRTDEVLVHVSNLTSALEDVESRLTGKARLYVPQSAIPVQRDDLHPYVMLATPPTYDFTQRPATPDAAMVIGHPIRLQADLLQAALANIKAAWPQMHEQITECVRIVGYLPDCTFRSCSAARYSGIVYLGNMDESILDLEESIVHETGHQVLYQLGELAKLTEPNTPLDANYVLPWSGSQRDLFGFLHAHYIYVLLVKYYWRRASVNERDAAECYGRALLILSGCLTATTMLQEDANLSKQGKIIVNRLAEDLAKIKDDSRTLFSAKEAAHGNANR